VVPVITGRKRLIHEISIEQDVGSLRQLLWKIDLRHFQADDAQIVARMVKIL